VAGPRSRSGRRAPNADVYAGDAGLATIRARILEYLVRAAGLDEE